MNLLPQHITACIEALENWGNIEVTAEQVVDIVKDSEFIKELHQWYPNEHNNSLDTADRDWLFDIFANHLGFPQWPLNMDTVEYKDNFSQALEKFREANVSG